MKKYTFIDADELAKELSVLIDRHTTTSVRILQASVVNENEARESRWHAAMAEAYKRVLDMVAR